MYVFQRLPRARSLLKTDTRFQQPRCPQIRRQSPNCHQRKPTPPTPPVLQEQEIPSPRLAAEADAGNQAAINEGGGESGYREAAEETDAFPHEELCRQGM